MKKALTETHTL